MSVLELLAARGAVSLADLSRELAIAKSTLHRICGVLVDRGWVIRDKSGTFELGIRALGMSARSPELPIATAFRGVAAWLLTRHDETVCLAAMDGDYSVFVAKEDTSQPVRLVTTIGARTPAFASAIGRVHLASWPPDAVAAAFGGRPDGDARRPAAERHGRAGGDPRPRPRAGLRRERRGDRVGPVGRLGARS